MNNENLPQPIENKDEFIKEFFAIQQQEVAVKRDELAIRKEETKLNQEVALASITSQEIDYVSRKSRVKTRRCIPKNSNRKILALGGFRLIICFHYWHCYVS